VGGSVDGLAGAARKQRLLVNPNLSVCILTDCYPSHRVCKPAYLVPVLCHDKLGELCQEGHPA